MENRIERSFRDFVAEIVLNDEFTAINVDSFAKGFRSDMEFNTVNSIIEEASDGDLYYREYDNCWYKSYIIEEKLGDTPTDEDEMAFQKWLETEEGKRSVYMYYYKDYEEFMASACRVSCDIYKDYGQFIANCLIDDSAATIRRDGDYIVIENVRRDTVYEYMEDLEDFEAEDEVIIMNKKYDASITEEETTVNPDLIEKYENEDLWIRVDASMRLLVTDLKKYAQRVADEMMIEYKDCPEDALEPSITYWLEDALNFYHSKYTPDIALIDTWHLDVNDIEFDDYISEQFFTELVNEEVEKLKTETTMKN